MNPDHPVFSDANDTREHQIILSAALKNSITCPSDALKLKYPALEKASSLLVAHDNQIQVEVFSIIGEAARFNTSFWHRNKQDSRIVLFPRATHPYFHCESYNSMNVLIEENPATAHYNLLLDDTSAVIRLTPNEATNAGSNAGSDTN